MYYMKTNKGFPKHMAKRNHYLSNKELLKEIHKSKMTYCWTKEDDPEKYGHFDLIVDDIKKVNRTLIKEAKQVRANRLQKQAHEAEVLRWERGELERKTKPRAADFAVDLKTIKDTDVIIRVMTFDHIPEEQRKNKPKTEADVHSRCNFPPYKHYVKNENKEWEEVVRSHWQGGIDNGYFSIDHGKTTDKLARMYMMLCNRYSMRGNWRGYTYVDEMRGQALLQLAQIGLQFNEQKSVNPFAYYTAAINNSFTRVLNLEKRSQNIRDDLLEEGGLNPSFTRTFNAEWETKQKQLQDEKDKKLKINTKE